MSYADLDIDQAMELLILTCAIEEVRDVDPRRIRGATEYFHPQFLAKSSGGACAFFFLLFSRACHHVQVDGISLSALRTGASVNTTKFSRVGQRAQSITWYTHDLHLRIEFITPGKTCK
jgi:hypothetical protein